MKPLIINCYTLTCGAGVGMDAIRASISKHRSGLSNAEWYDCELDTWLGRVKALDMPDVVSSKLPPEWESRNNRLADLGVMQDDFPAAVAKAISAFGAQRCALIIGTSTSSIGRTEQAYRQLEEGGHFPSAFRQEHIHNPHAPAAFLAERLGTAGPNMTISTACSSSAKVFAAATRWLEQGIADAVIVGGVDSLCQSVIYGFNSLQLVDSEACKPFDMNRNGISLGEAAGFMLLTREPLDDSGIRLLGYGESSDAYHMSSAHPDGLGAELAMHAAIERSGLDYDQLDYVNLHGTGTRTNDHIEGRVCSRLLARRTLCSSTKSWTGHTLGAAGITEAVLTIDAMRTGVVPGCLNTTNPESALADQLALDNLNVEIQFAMSNSFGFGGNNCSLVFGRA
jgi:3-oxoacyl-[acyl-carrier-protein] synthase-1